MNNLGSEMERLGRQCTIFNIFIGLMAANGMLLISTKTVFISFAKGVTELRRPLTRMGVESVSKPRNDILKLQLPVSSLLLF
jgi:hypothetical protein